MIELGGLEFQYERGTYGHEIRKAGGEAVVEGQLLREEGGFDLETWRMTIICRTEDEFLSLSGLYIKQPPDDLLVFRDRLGQEFEVYFDNFGPVSSEKLRGLYRVPILLRRRQN